MATVSPASLFALVGRKSLKFRSLLVQSLPSMTAPHLCLVQEERLFYVNKDPWLAVRLHGAECVGVYLIFNHNSKYILFKICSL